MKLFNLNAAAASTCQRIWETQLPWMPNSIKTSALLLLWMLLPVSYLQQQQQQQQSNNLAHMPSDN